MFDVTLKDGEYFICRDASDLMDLIEDKMGHDVRREVTDYIEESIYRDTNNMCDGCGTYELLNDTFQELETISIELDRELKKDRLDRKRLQDNLKLVCSLVNNLYSNL